MALAERAARQNPELRQHVIGVLEGFAKQRPDSDATHYALAVLFDTAGNNPKALASYERYPRITPWNERVQRPVEVLRGKER